MPSRKSSSLSRDYPPAQSLGGTLRVLSEAWNAAFHAEIDRHGVTSGQWRFLRELWYEDGITQSELADRVGRKGPTTGTALKLLVRNGLARLERSTHDRRKIRVHLTKKGRALEAKLLPLIGRFDALATRGLSTAEVATFYALMQRLKDSVDALAATDWPHRVAAAPPRRVTGMSQSRSIGHPPLRG